MSEREDNQETAVATPIEEGVRAMPSAQSQHFSQFQTSLTQYGDVESKLQVTIDFMEASLAQSGTPHFRNFWEARKLSLELFKENIPSALRTVLWKKYTDLSKEARRLKEILDEQCSFAVEQIEKAIHAIEEDLLKVEENLKALPPLEFPFPSAVIQRGDAFYQKVQSELDLLNALATRISALRKELIKTEMRVKQKNQFFKRLSSLGDSVFPRRKGLIKEVSDRFVQDVDRFVRDNFVEEKGDAPLFGLRDEIKALQCMAKFLTLNTHAFNDTREKLSGCWDQMKQVERERKKERSEQRNLFKKNASDILLKIEEIKALFSTSELTTHQAREKCSEISGAMRDVELGRDEVRDLREALNGIQQVILEKEGEEVEKLRLRNREREEQRTKKFEQFKEEIQTAIQSSLELPQLTDKYEAFIQQQRAEDFTKNERLQLKPLFNQLSDKISKRKEQAIYASSGDAGRQLQELMGILEERKVRRSEVKAQIEVFRLAQGSSSSDFELAWSQSLLLDAEKERLEEIDQSIREVEHKIATLEKSIGA